jgi:hypothetical protein
MTKDSASLLDHEAEASPVTITALQKATYYFESRYNLWKRRSIPGYSADEEEMKHLEKAAAYCLEHQFEPFMYFQSQVDSLELPEEIASYAAKSFSTKAAVDRANHFRKARIARDKALQVLERPSLVRVS